MSFSWNDSEAKLVAPVASSVEKRRSFVYDVLRAKLRERAGNSIGEVVKDTGIEPAGIVIQATGTMWSSCSRKTGNIFVNTLITSF